MHSITSNVTAIFITTSLLSAQQGPAGALINSVMQLATAVCQGMSAIIGNATESKGLKRSYQAVFWFEFACAARSLSIPVMFVKTKSATPELTGDERVEVDRLNSAAAITADQTLKADDTTRSRLQIQQVAESVTIVNFHLYKFIELGSNHLRRTQDVISEIYEKKNSRFLVKIKTRNPIMAHKTGHQY